MPIASISAGRRRCKLHPDVFCYISGCFTVPKQRQNITDFVKKAYLAYFGIKLGDQDKFWAPPKVCKTCIENLRQCIMGKRKSLSFGIPMIWREPANQVGDCYFCIIIVAEISSKNKSKINYPNISSVMRPVPHFDSIPVPTFNSFTQSFNETDTCTSEDSSIQNDKQHLSSDQEKLPVLIKKSFLNDLERDLNLPEGASELLKSRIHLHHNNLLVPETAFLLY